VPDSQSRSRPDAQRILDEALRVRHLLTPEQWVSRWDGSSGRFTEFGWHDTVVRVKGTEWKTDTAILNGGKQAGFGIRRPELPGVSWAKLRGYWQFPLGFANLNVDGAVGPILQAMPHALRMRDYWSAQADEMLREEDWLRRGPMTVPYIPSGLPKTGPIGEAVRKMMEENWVRVPVLVPAIEVPDPYDGVRLVRRIRAHAQQWKDWGLASDEVLASLNRQFAALISALEGGKNESIADALSALEAELHAHHPDLSVEALADEREGAGDALPRPPHGQAAGASTDARVAPALHPVAASALLFNLRYVRDRRGEGRGSGAAGFR
jgi:hypothetical protein